MCVQISWNWSSVPFPHSFLPPFFPWIHFTCVVCVVCTYAPCVLMHVYSGVCMCEDQRGWHWCLPYFSPSYFLRCLSLYPELDDFARLAGQWTPVFLSLPPFCWGRGLSFALLHCIPQACWTIGFQRSLLSPPPSHHRGLRTQIHDTAPVFLCGFWELNLG